MGEGEGVTVYTAEELRGVSDGELEAMERERAALEEAAWKALVPHEYGAFLRFVKVEQEARLVGGVWETGKPISPDAGWRHLEELDTALMLHRRIVVPKSRKIGITTRIAAYLTWVAAYHIGAKILCFSKGQTEAQLIISLVRYIINHLPEDIRPRLKGEGSTELLTFKPWSGQSRSGSGVEDEESFIMSLPSTVEAGVSFTASVLNMDEADYHPFFQKNYDTAANATVSGGGQVILTSTINPETAASGFKEIVTHAEAMGYKRLFFGWRVRPGRDEAWYEAEKKTYLVPYNFYKNFPDSLEEALAVPQGLLFFDIEALNRMKSGVRPPIGKTGVAGHIWTFYVPGHRYSVGTDTAHGVGRDDSVTVVKDFNTDKVVADVHANNLTPEQFYEENAILLTMYRNPIWGIEDNDWGRVLIAKALEHHYPKLFMRTTAQNHREPGWRTMGNTREQLWSALREEVASGALSIPSEAGLAQFFDVIHKVKESDPQKRVRIEAREGGKDDYPIAMAIALQMEPYATPAWEPAQQRHRQRVAVGAVEL